MKKETIVLLGGGGHAISLADAIERKGKFHIIGYTALTPSGVFPYPYLGRDAALRQLYADGIHNAAAAVGYLGEGNIRDYLYTFAKEIGFVFPVIIDPDAIISDKTDIGEGTFIGKGVIINAETRVGKMCIVNTGAILEHQNQIDDFTHVACGSILCGNVRVGKHCLIGAGSTIIQGITVEDHAIIGAGSIVTKSVQAGRMIIQRRNTEESAS